MQSERQGIAETIFEARVRVKEGATVVAGVCTGMELRAGARATSHGGAGARGYWEGVHKGEEEEYWDWERDHAPKSIGGSQPEGE